MAITHVGITPVQSFSSTINLALPAGVQAGDLLIANVVIGAGATVNLTVPAGWTIAQNDTPDAFRHSQWVAYAIYDGSSSYEFSLSAVKGSRLFVNAYRDVNQSTPVESSEKAYADNNANINSAVLSVANSGSVEFACCADLNGASRTFTAPAGTTELFNSASYPSMTMYERSVSPSATTAQTVTVSPNTKMSLMNLVINPAGGGGATVPQGTTEITGVTPGETTASVAFTYSAADATEFDLYIDGVYQSTTASSPASASGLTASTTYTATIVPVNATGDGTPSAGVQFTTNAAAPQVPQGTVTIGSITVGTTTATVPYTYSAADQTGFEYRLNGGAPVADAASPVDLTGLTENTAYTVEVRAVNGTGAGAWSAVGNFTTNAAAPTLATFTSGILHDNTRTPVANTTLLHATLYDPVTGELVVRVNSPTTNAQGRVVIAHAAISAGTDYDLNAEMLNGESIMPRGTAV